MLLGEAALTASYGCGGQERAWLANFKVSLGEAFHCSDCIIEFLTFGRQGLVFCLSGISGKIFGDALAG